MTTNVALLSKARGAHIFGLHCSKGWRVSERKPDEVQREGLRALLGRVLPYSLFLMATGGAAALWGDLGAGPAFLVVGLSAAVLIIAVSYAIRSLVRSQQDS